MKRRPVAARPCGRELTPCFHCSSIYFQNCWKASWVDLGWATRRKATHYSAPNILPNSRLLTLPENLGDRHVLIMIMLGVKRHLTSRPPPRSLCMPLHEHQANGQRLLVIKPSRRPKPKKIGNPALAEDHASTVSGGSRTEGWESMRPWR